MLKLTCLYISKSIAIFNNILKLRQGAGYILSKWDAHYLNGGNSTSKSVYINNTTLSEISVGDYLETKYAGIFNEVIDIVEDISIPNSTRSKLILSLKVVFFKRF